MVPRLVVFAATLLSLFATGCATESPASARSQERIPALVRIGESGKVTDVPEVLPSLASDDPLVRWTAQRTLLNLTGTTNGYDWSADRVDRERAIDAWREWCVKHGVTGRTEGDGRA